MKFYKSKNAKVGEGVEATVLFHKDNGDELICVRSDWDSFESQNPKAKECSREDADKLLKKAKIKISVPKRKVLRKKKKLSDDEILAEIGDEKTKTVDISKKESDDGQILIYYEDMEITTTDDFIRSQKSQQVELKPEVVEEEESELTVV